jgi:hypothetical protein
MFEPYPLGLAGRSDRHRVIERHPTSAHVVVVAGHSEIISRGGGAQIVGDDSDSSTPA